MLLTHRLSLKTKELTLRAQALEKAERNHETLYVCYNHTPPYSSLKPVEVKLT